MTTTRSLIAAMQVTLDGFSSPGDADWVDSWADALDLLPPVDAFVLGAGMWPDYEQWWTTILDDPQAASAMLGRDVYPRETAYARLAAQTPHLVLSKSLHITTLPTARIVGAVDDIAALKQERGNAVYVVGGPTIVTSLMNHGLLDELHLIVHPVVVGAGIPLLAGLDKRTTLGLVSVEHTATGRLHVAYRVHTDEEI